MKFKNFEDISKYLVKVSKSEDISVLSYADDIMEILNSIMSLGINLQFIDLDYDAADLEAYYLGINYDKQEDCYNLVIYKAKNNSNGFYYPRHGISIINNELYEEYDNDMKYYKEKFKYTSYYMEDDNEDNKETSIKKDEKELELFTDPKSGEVNGYKAQWEEDGVKYHYECHGFNNINVEKLLDLFQ